MILELGKKYNAKADSVCGSSIKNATLVKLMFEGDNPSNRQLAFLKKLDGVVVYYLPTSLTEVKTQTLYAYQDDNNEVHWSTKKYNESELKRFDFIEKFEFNKTIELE